MKIGIVVNESKIKSRETVTNFVSLLERQNYCCSVFAKNEDIADVNALIVLGGDGAVLHSAVCAAKKNIPYFAIVGEQEIADGVVNIKNQITGEQIICKKDEIKFA